MMQRNRAERVRNAAADEQERAEICYGDSFYQSRDLESAAAQLGLFNPGEAGCAPE